MPSAPARRRAKACVASFHAVGFAPVLLRGDHDLRQGWLGFVEALVLSPKQASAAAKLRRPSRHWLEAQWRSSHGTTKAQESHGALYVYEKDVHQIVLPFADRQQVTDSEVGDIERLGWPGFERAADGSLPVLVVPRSMRFAFERWCCDAPHRGRYRFCSFLAQARFEHLEDLKKAGLALDDLSAGSAARRIVVVRKARQCGARGTAPACGENNGATP